MAEEIINNEEPTEENQDDSSQSKESTEEVEKEVDKTEDSTDEDKYKDVPFDKHPRWAELKSELGDVKATSERQAAELASLKTLMSAKASDEQKDAAWEKIKKLDVEGFSSYEELTKNILEVFKDQTEKDNVKKAETFEESRQANIKQMQSDLTMLTNTGLLTADEQEDFIEWCATKLEETTDATHPQGNVALYADLQRAISHYRHAKGATTDKTDEKKRLDRSKVGASGTSENPTQKMTSEDLKNTPWGNVKFT